MEPNPYAQYVDSGNPYSQWAETGGGAAVGNPMLLRQGDKALRRDVQGANPLAAITGAGVIGGGLGAVAPEILSGAATVARVLPGQFSGLAGPLSAMSSLTRAAGRPASAITGAVSGVAGETAGQLVDATGANPVYGEAARLVAGGVGGESLQAARYVLQKYALVPALSLLSKFKHEGAKKLLESLNLGTGKIGDQEKALLASITNEIKGSSGEADLQSVGSIMGNEGKRLMSQSEVQMAKALSDAGRKTVDDPMSIGNAAGYPAKERTLADIGGELQNTIVTRNKSALGAREAEIQANKKARDDLVTAQQNSRKYVSNLPEYNAIVNELEAQLNNTNMMARSPSVQASYKSLLNDLKNPKLDVFGQPEPISFQALDDVRRKLGESFRGKPDEGYGAIQGTAAKDLYQKVRDIQVKYAGGENGPQAKLLDDYHASTKGLEPFSSRLGKKVTALDQYREGQFPDPSTIPDTFFKTKASVQALTELTGNRTQVQSAALHYADKQLAGKDSTGVNKWMSENAEWLNEVPATRSLIEKYSARLDGAERSMRVATDFTKQAQNNADLLIGKGVPAQKAIDLIKSGDSDMWKLVTPAIAKSPQAKTDMVNAVRKVVSDQAGAPAMSDWFNRNLRHFLENSGIANKQQMDSIAQNLERIKNLKVSETEKLGKAKRFMLEAAGGWAASAASRGGVASYGAFHNMTDVPQPPNTYLQGQQQ